MTTMLWYFVYGLLVYCKKIITPTKYGYMNMTLEQRKREGGEIASAVNTYKVHDLFIYEMQHVGSRKSPLPFRLIQRAMKLIVRSGVYELVLGMSHGSHDSESYNRGIRNCAIYEVKLIEKSAEMVMRSERPYPHQFQKTLA